MSGGETRADSKCDWRKLATVAFPGLCPSAISFRHPRSSPGEAGRAGGALVNLTRPASIAVLSRPKTLHHEPLFIPPDHPSERRDRAYLGEEAVGTHAEEDFRHPFRVKRPPRLGRLGKARPERSVLHQVAWPDVAIAWPWLHFRDVLFCDVAPARAMTARKNVPSARLSCGGQATRSEAR